MRIAILLLASVALYAQTKAPAPPAPAPDVLPAHWLGVSVSYNPSQSPRTTGGATLANSIGSQMYNYNTADLTVLHGKLVSSTRTGMALVHPLYEDKLYLVVFGNVGVATTAANASFSTAGGGLVFYRLGKKGNYTVHAGFHVMDAGALSHGPVNVPEAGLGFAF